MWTPLVILTKAVHWSWWRIITMNAMFGDSIIKGRAGDSKQNF
jgi:hypothetical protein